jgi:WD40 repeat protein
LLIKKVLKNLLKTTLVITISFYFLITILLTSNLILSTTSSAEEAENSEPVTPEDILTDSKINTIGVQWKYRRPDNGPGGNATSWKLRWSPDGKLIAVVYFDNTVVILNGKTGQPEHALGTSADIIMGKEIEDNTRTTRCYGFTTNPKVPLLRACEWSPDGKLLAVAGDHKIIEIYNTTTWTQIMKLEGHFGSVLSLAWSPDGTKLASGEGTDQVLWHNVDECRNVIKIWDMPTGDEITTLWGHKDSIVSIDWADDNIRLTSASDDSNLKMWNTSNNSVIHTLGEGLGHSAGVLDVDWSPNQTLLVSGSRDFKIRLWNVATGKPFSDPWKDNNCVRSTHWHPSGRYVLTAGVDQSIKIRNATNGKEMRIFEEASNTNSEVMSARWSPDGMKFVACSTIEATVRLYAIGFEESDTSDEVFIWSEGIPIFFIIAIIGTFLIYFSLRKELREHRK